MAAAMSVCGVKRGLIQRHETIVHLSRNVRDGWKAVIADAVRATAGNRLPLTIAGAVAPLRSLPKTGRPPTTRP